MKLLSKKKLTQTLLPLLLISMMLGTIAYQGLLMSDSTQLSPKDSIEGLLDSLPVKGLPMMNAGSIQDASSSGSPWDSVGGDPRLPETLDVGKFLSDNTGDYQKIWEPWLTKAGIHDIAVSPNGEFLAVGGGYLYDNELHVYRWNDILGKYVRAWESGDGIFQGDIRAVALGDTDQNLFLEMAGACSDGYVYVFEQTHIFDPNTRTETRFDLVWTSPYVGSAWGVEIADTDLDKIADIVVGAWDAGLAWFEYSNHSGYPYTPEHWIDYREAFRLPIDGHIQSLTTADINGNGLPDVVVGTQEGYLYIIENDGTVIGDESGVSFSIPQDNRYRVIWESKGPVWSPIMKLDSGQLDSDAAFEAVVVARGQGVYALDYDSTLNDFILTKMVRPLESWETPKNQFGEDLGYPLDHYIDWMLYPATGNVTFTNSTGYTWDEPWNYGDNPQDYILNPANEVVQIYPYNTSIAQKPEIPKSSGGHILYTVFDALASPEGIASAILDFGKDEEATGDARPGIPTALTGYDLEIYCNATPNLATINLSISPDLENWEPVANTSLAVSGKSLFVDIDAALAARQWRFARYLNVTVHSDGVLGIDAIYTKLVNKQLDSACSAIIGQVNFEWDNPNEQNKIIIGTVEGRMLVYQFDSVAGSMALLFDSYTDERYVLGSNVWDIAAIPEGPRTTVPTWIAEEGNALISDRGVIFRGHEYKLFTDAKTWNQAQADCAAQGGHLVTISDADENEFVRQLAGGARVWIGLTDNAAWGASNHNWEWITGQAIQPTDYANWAPGEPNDWASNEDYGEMYGNGRWNDWTSTAYSSYICEWEHDYSVVTSPANTWANAKTNAEARGGHLVAITSPEEYELVNDLVEAEIVSGQAWIGLWDDPGDVVEANYTWITGEGYWISDQQNTTNAYWDAGQPYPTPPSLEDYVYMQNGLWTDTVAATSLVNWVVEWEFGFGRMTPDVVSSISMTSIDWSSRSIVLANSSDAANPFRTYYYTGEGYRSYPNSQGLSRPKNDAVNLLGGQYSGISAAFGSFKTESKYSADFGRNQSIPKSFSFAVFDTNNPYSPNNPSQYTAAEIRVYETLWSWGGAWGYWDSYALHEQETTGQLTTVLKMSQIQPTMAWGDMDGDGREDIIIANGKLYLIRNVGYNTWELVPDYFVEINQGSNLYSNPQLVDFDADGDLDLVMSEARNKLPGLFYWVNIGSRTSPSWEFRRQDLVNLRTEGSGDVKQSTFLHYNGYTMFTMEYGESLNDTLGMLALNNRTKLTIDYFKADYESQNSFIVGINPYVARVDMNLRPLSITSTEDKNYGYRILKTWDTEPELAQWTQAITATDLDGDGKRELVVGDFDNNLYVFEHLTNNTYKRAYRSFDLSRQINTTESPYAAELLEGVSASFIRFEWQHVERVIGGMDLDGDGFQEFAAIAGLTLYLFEHTGRDDSYQLIWSTNLGDTAWAPVFDYLQLTSFTALAPSTDANYNGKDELLAAVGPFLFIFEGYADNEISEIFMNPSLENMFSIGSKYVLPENGLLHYFATYDGSFDLEITQLYVGDVIKDTPEKEILIVGVNRTSWGHEHGFGMIMRHRGVSFIHVADFPREATWLNPVYDLTVDDQDYDGQPEIILGHAHGVDIWEVHLTQSGGSGGPSGAFSLVRQSTLSGSLNYPNTQPSNPIFDAFIKTAAPRETEMIALRQAIGSPLSNSYLPQGALVQVYSSSRNETTGRLHWSYSTDNGSTWQYKGLLFPWITSIVNTTEPALFQDITGRLWLTFTTIYYSSPNYYQAINLYRYNPQRVNPWQYQRSIAGGVLPGDRIGSPSIFAYPKDPKNDSWLSISFLDKAKSNVAIGNYHIPTKALSYTYTTAYGIPEINGTTYIVHSCDVLYQDHGPGNGSLLVAFAGRKAAEVRLDNDMWVASAEWSTVLDAYNWSLPIRITKESTTETDPELAQLQSADGTVLLTFEMQGPIVACHSKTGGLSWSVPEQLLTQPDFMIYRYFPALGFALATWTENPNVIFSDIEVHSPTIATFPFGGFAYSYTMSYSAYLLEKIPLDTDTISDGASQYATGATYQYLLVPLTSPETIANYYINLGAQSTTYATTVGYYLLQTVAQSLYSIATNVSNSFPPTTSGFLTTSISSTEEDLYNSTVDGDYYNILTRTNLANWMAFDFTEARKIDVGDTDGDARREIALLSGSQVYLVEIEHSLPSSLSYQQFWISGELAEFTDIALYDANDNGFEEFFASAKGGNIYAFEIINLDLPRALLQFINTEQIADYSWTPLSERWYHPILASFDADGDGLNELILSDSGSASSNLTILPGISLTNESLALTKQLNGRLTTLAYQDVTLDGFDDLAYGTDQGEYGIIDIYSSFTHPNRSIVFAYPNQTISEPIQSLEPIYRVTADAWALLLVGSSNVILTPAFGTGILWNATGFGGNSLVGGTIGGFGISQAEVLDVVVIDELGTIYLLDQRNGSAAENITKYSSSSSQDVIFTVADLNADGIDDLLLGLNNQFLVGMDGLDRSTLFNYTDFKTREIFRQVIARDIDSDGSSDIILTSDSSFTNLTYWTSYNSFETGSSGDPLTTLPNINLAGAQTLGNGTVTNIPGDYYQPAITITSPAEARYLVSPSDIWGLIWLNYTDTSYSPSRELWLDDVLLGEAPPSGTQYYFLAQAPSHNLTLVTKDVFNRTATDTAIFTVDKSAITTLDATIITPGNNTTYRTSSVLFGYQTRTPDSIASVELWVDEADETGNYVKGDYIPLSDGPHNITIWVTDTGPGPRTARSSVYFTVDTTPLLGRNIVSPTEGDYCLTATGLTAQFVFQTPVRRFSFFLSANGSAEVQLAITLAGGGGTQIIEFEDDRLGTQFEYDAIDLGFEAIAQFMISASSPLVWYIDELECDILQPGSYVRRFSQLGELIWEYNPPMDRIPWIEIGASDGAVSPIGLVGLAATRDVGFTNDPRGLIGLDLVTGLPTFHAGLQENAHGGILGVSYDPITPFLADGAFVTELGTVYEFQFIDRLFNQTLPNVTASIEPNWELHLSGPVEFLETADLNLDGYPDVIAIASNGEIIAANGVDDQILWRRRVNDQPVVMRLGDFVGNEVPDIFLSFEGGSFIVINGATSLVAWKKQLNYRNIESAENIGEYIQNSASDGYDDLVIGTSVQGQVDSIGYLYLVNGSTGSTIANTACPGPVVQITLGKLPDAIILNAFVVNFRNGLRVYNITSFEVFNDISEKLLQFTVANESLVGVTVNGDLIYYDALNRTSPSWTHSLADDTGYQSNHVHSVTILNANGTNTAIVGIVGVGLLSYNLTVSVPSAPNWYFRDSSARVASNQFLLVNWSEDATYDVLTKNGDLAYIIDGQDGSLLWRTEQQAISGDLSSMLVAVFNETHGNEIVIGMEEGSILKFSHSEVIRTTNDTIFVPWYYRYQQRPVTPAPSLRQRSTTEGARLMGSTAAKHSVIRWQNDQLASSDYWQLFQENSIDNWRLYPLEVSSAFTRRR